MVTLFMIATRECINFILANFTKLCPFKQLLLSYVVYHCRRISTRKNGFLGIERRQTDAILEIIARPRAIPPIPSPAPHRLPHRTQRRHGPRNRVPHRRSGRRRRQAQRRPGQRRSHGRGRGDPGDIGKKAGKRRPVEGPSLPDPPRELVAATFQKVPRGAVSLPGQREGSGGRSVPPVRQQVQLGRGVDGHDGGSSGQGRGTGVVAFVVAGGVVQDDLRHFVELASGAMDVLGEGADGHGFVPSMGGEEGEEHGEAGVERRVDAGGAIVLWLWSLLGLSLMQSLQLFSKIAVAFVHEKGYEIGTSKKGRGRRCLTDVRGRKTRVEGSGGDGFVGPSFVVNSLEGVGQYGVSTLFDGIVGMRIGGGGKCTFDCVGFVWDDGLDGLMAQTKRGHDVACIDVMKAVVKWIGTAL